MRSDALAFELCATAAALIDILFDSEVILNVHVSEVLFNHPFKLGVEHRSLLDLFGEALQTCKGLGGQLEEFFHCFSWKIILV